MATISWRIVTHGAIDGHTRMIVYLQFSTNDQASTVHKLFLTAVERFGLPSRIRSDLGGENHQVTLHMLRHRGTDRDSMITGSSVRSQPKNREAVICTEMLRFCTTVHFTFSSSIACLIRWMNLICLLFICVYTFLELIKLSKHSRMAGITMELEQHVIYINFISSTALSPQQLYVQRALQLSLVAMDFL